jgi:hypothetical protein
VEGQELAMLVKETGGLSVPQAIDCILQGPDPKPCPGIDLPVLASAPSVSC